MISNKKKGLRTWLIAIALLCLISIVAVYVAGQVARNNLAKRYPAPGMMLSAQDHKLHVHCNGEGPVTVFLVAGLNEFSLQWSQLQPLLASETKTCSYDRAGLGWSEPTDNVPTLDNSVKDLHAVLQAIRDNHPVVLVGHSYGAILVRMYVQQFPDNIKAVVLLDPASEYMAEHIAGYAEALDAAAEQFKSLVPLGSLGLIAFAKDNIPAGLLQGEAIEQYRAVLATGDFFNSASIETKEMINNLQLMQKTRTALPAKLPVVILSRGQPEPIPGLPEASARSLEQTWSTLQAELVNRLNAERIIAEKSGHSIQLTQPELVFETVRPFISDRK